MCVFIGLNMIFLCFGRGLYLLGPAEVCEEHMGLTGLLGPESLKAVLGFGHLRSALRQAFDWIEYIMCSHSSVQHASLLKACPPALRLSYLVYSSRAVAPLNLFPQSCAPRALNTLLKEIEKGKHVQATVCLSTPTSLRAGVKAASPASLSLLAYLRYSPPPYSPQNLHGPQGGELRAELTPGSPPG